jgi:hypothetical protein
MAGGSPANHIARWDGNNWSSIGSGMNDAVRSLAWDGTYLYAGGSFTMAGGNVVRNIARWDGSSWSEIGGGVDWPQTSNATVSEIIWTGNDLYVIGQFTHVDGQPIPHIVRWDGSSWHSLDSGLSGAGSSAVWTGEDLYVGGYFYTAGETFSRNFARWSVEGSIPEGYRIFLPIVEG